MQHPTKDRNGAQNASLNNHPNDRPNDCPNDCPNDWWKSAVIYQIYPRSFYDANNDGVGDLKGIIKKLSYLNDGKGGGLGVDAIWLSPIFCSPMKDFGYDISDYQGIDPIFGTLEDFEELVATAHSLGMKVLLDLVFNHSSDQHPWFIQSKKDKTNPYADWYVWREAKDGAPPNNWVSVFGGPAWTFDETRQQYYMHSFLKEQPDLNWYNEKVRTALMDAVRFWVHKGVDGFRLDTINYYAFDQELRDNPPYPNTEGRDITIDFERFESSFSKDRPENFENLKLLRQTLEELSPHLTTIGEMGGILDVDKLAALSAAYVKGKEHLHMAYNFALLSDQLDLGFVHRVIQRTEKSIEDGWPCWSLGNHDTMRLLTRAKNQSFEWLQAMYGLLLTLRGTPIIYYGEELGMPDYAVQHNELQDPFGKHYWPKYKGRDGCRTPFAWDQQLANQGFNAGAKPWLPATAPVSLAAQKEQAGSMFEWFKELLSLRKQHQALQVGSFEVLEHHENVLVFKRSFETQQLVIGLNFSPATLELDLKLNLSLLPLKNIKVSGEFKAGRLHIFKQGLVIAKVV